MKTLKTLFISILLTTLLCSCANLQPLNTPTGRPEVTIPRTDISDVKGAISQAALDWGYYTKSVTDYAAVFEKRDTRIGMAILAGSQYDSTPMWRLTFNFVSMNGNVRVVANIHLVTNPGSAFERINDVSTSGKGAQNTQTMLENIRAYLVNSALVKKQGKIGITFNKSLLIQSVVPSGPADQAGLKANDKIIAVDGMPIKIYEDTTLRITGAPGSSVKIRVNRDGKEQEFTVVRGQP